MHTAHVAIFPLLLAVGCAGIAPDAPPPEAEVLAPQAATPQSAAKPAVTQPSPLATPRAPPVPAAPTPAGPVAGKVVPPVARAPAAPVALAPKSPASPAAAPPAPTAPPPLDLNALKEQLKETKSIGVFTKLTLKNQVDDLLDQFREYYQGRAKVTIAELRRSYDLLMMKVLSLLQDADQKLASAIVASREAIWGLLSDPKKFATLQT
jgi:hypothetical protein